MSGSLKALQTDYSILPLNQLILRTPLRSYFVQKVKEPIKKLLALVCGRLPDITKENTIFINTHTLIDIYERFIEHQRHPGHDDMFASVFKILLLEIEHDVYYRDRFNWFIEEIIKAILRGDWEERTNGHPPPPMWEEAEHYGGKYSIIKILQNKVALEKLMGAEWRLQED